MKNNNKKFLITALLILALGFFFLTRNQSETKDENTKEGDTNEVVVTEVTKTYVNEKYGYSFEYPKEYSIIEYSNSRISVGQSTTSGFISIADISVFESQDEAAQSFEEFVLDQARLSCTGPVGVVISCVEIDGLRPFVSSSGEEGQKFFLIGETGTSANGPTKDISYGPYYTFNLSKRTPNRMSFIMINNPLSTPIDTADTKTLDTIALSLGI